MLGKQGLLLCDGFQALLQTAYLVVVVLLLGNEEVAQLADAVADMAGFWGEDLSAELADALFGAWQGELWGGRHINCLR
jgi:hypothetical protein